MNLPKLPVETKPFLWGAAAGAVALAIAGFSWERLGDRRHGRERLAGVRADAAIVAALAPICVTQFQANAGAGTSLPR